MAHTLIINEPETILPDFVVHSMRLAEMSYCLPDAPEKKKFNKNYLFPVSYKFNSRGYRDAEWPPFEQLSQAIWCFGDSFTVGIGAPYPHIWPQRLEYKTKTRTINVSMSGASNEWMYRKMQLVLQEIQPQTMVVQWTFPHRREKSIDSMIEKQWQTHYKNIRGSNWPDCTFAERDKLPDWILKEISSRYPMPEVTIHDEDRRINPHKADIELSDQTNIDHTIDLIQKIESIKKNTNIIHSVITGFGDMIDDKTLLKQFESLPFNFIPEFPMLDRARDLYHYDIKTADFFVNKFINFMDFKINE